MRLTIIGGGPGGYTAAFAAAKAECEVTLVEAASIGGICLNHGCIPTKALRASADAINMASRMAEYGVDGCDNALINMQVVNNRKNHVIEVLHGGLVKACQKYKINCIQGHGRIVDAQTVEVTTNDGVSSTVTGDAIIIATGSDHLALPGIAIDHKVIVDSDDALELTSVPKRLLILGGGVIGSEMACIYRSFGSEVTIVQRRDRLLSSPYVDKDVSTLVNREMRKQKIKVITDRTLKNVRVENGVVRGLIVASPYVQNADINEEPFEADMLLVTVGRAPMTTGLGLAEAGVAVDSKGWVKVSPTLETSLPHVYAIGDILGPDSIMLAHVSAMEALCALENILGQHVEMRYDVVPAAIFTSPEIGYVGLSEAEAKKKYNIVCSTFQMRELGKSQASGELPGFLKLVADADTGRVLGVHMAGAHTTDMIAEAALAIKMHATAADIAHTIHAHPTLSEGFYEAARLAQEEIQHNHGDE